MSPTPAQSNGKFSRGRMLPAGLIAAMALWLLHGYAALAQTPFIGTDWSTYQAGEDILVTFKNVPGKPKDWVGIYPEGAVPGAVGSTL